MLRCFNKSARQNSPCSACCRQKRDKIRPARLAVVKNETKFALHAQNMRKSGIPSELGEFCTEYEVSRFLLGEFFHGTAAGWAVLGEYFRANRHCAGLGSSSAPSTLVAMGVLRHAKPSGGVSPACRRLGWRHSPRLVAGPRRRSRGEEAWMASFPPVGGGVTAPRGGVAAKVQTHWTKVAENGLFWLNGSALWRICCLSWRVVRT